MSIFYHLSSELRSYRAATKAGEAKADATRAVREVEELERRLERALLVCEAMWTIMREKLGLSDEELIERIKEVDLSDGKLDGRVRRRGTYCPSCGRLVPSKFHRCMYCGEEIEFDPFA